MSDPTSVPSDRRYTAEHEWAQIDGDKVVVGITDFAQHELGDVVYVEMPAVSSRVTATKEFGAVESVKSASDLYSPITGEVVARNAELTDHPEWVNESPYERGWMIHVRPDDLADMNGLLDADGYRQLIDA